MRGPVDLRLTASSPREFDRSKIIYIEHEGNFPKGPTQYPPADPLPLIPQPPTPNPPVPTQSATATAAPVVADTTEPSLMDRLQNPGPQKSVTGTSILFNNKVDGIPPLWTRNHGSVHCSTQHKSARYKAWDKGNIHSRITPVSRLFL